MLHIFVFTHIILLSLIFGVISISAQDRNLNAPLNFEGKYLISISDADMLASAYVDGKLGPREGQDVLSFIPLKGDIRSWSAIEVKASNSVAGPPAAIDVTPDGRYAFVIETFTQRPSNNKEHTFKDLKPGNILSVFDLKTSKKPKLIKTIKILQRPDSIRVNHDGTLIAVTFHPSGGGKKSPLALIPFYEGIIGEPVYPEVTGWMLNHRMIGLAWHPNENVLALINETGGNIRFVNVTKTLKIKVFGNVVPIERAPFRVDFTPDGRHVVVNALYWGQDIKGRWIEAPRGSLLTVRMNAEKLPNGSMRHAFISRINTGISPEGLALSPDGQWVATTNLERSYLPYQDKRITWYSSITLAKLSPETGILTKVGDYPYDGILPEAAVFDNSSRFLAVANYDHFDDRKTGGSIDFWRITKDPLEPDRVQFVKTQHSITVTRGVHSMSIVR